MSAARSRICRAAPPISPARWRSSAAGSPASRAATTVAPRGNMLPRAPPAPKPEGDPPEPPNKPLPAQGESQRKSEDRSEDRGIVLSPARAAHNSAAHKAAPSDPTPSRSHAQVLAAVRSAVEENRVDIYLQPMVTLPQRKVRFYEAVTRLRDEKDQILAA